ncbi:MAG TPA: hypothetical protein VEZ12_17720 [Herpetosiphonaceae bacterium]|nr:hypothetical protein [Herpetosiphonaceae bacterium]
MMMSYKQMQRRLEELEAKRAEQERAESQAWVESLSHAELEAWCADFAERDPASAAAFEAMSEEELDRAAAGRMSEAEWQQHLERAQERIDAAA